MQRQRREYRGRGQTCCLKNALRLLPLVGALLRHDALSRPAEGAIRPEVDLQIRVSSLKQALLLASSLKRSAD